MKTVFTTLLCAWALGATILACAPARSDVPAYAEMFTAPDGAQCYAIVSNGNVVGGNCK